MHPAENTYVSCNQSPFMLGLTLSQSLDPFYIPFSFSPPLALTPLGFSLIPSHTDEGYTYGARRIPGIEGKNGKRMIQNRGLSLCISVNKSWYAYVL